MTTTKSQATLSRIVRQMTLYGLNELQVQVVLELMQEYIEQLAHESMEVAEKIVEVITGGWEYERGTGIGYERETDGGMDSNRDPAGDPAGDREKENKMKLATLQIKGATFEVDVDSRGQFSTSLEGEHIVADSLEELRGKLGKRLARASAKVSIPFVRWESDRRGEDGKLCRGTIIGIHAANKNLLVKWDDSKGTNQDTSWSSDNKYIDPGVADEYERLCKAKEAAYLAVDEFVAKHRFDARERVKQELVKLLGKEAAAEINED